MVKKKTSDKKVRVGKLKENKEKIKELTDKEAKKIKGGLTISRSQSDAQKTTSSWNQAKRRNENNFAIDDFFLQGKCDSLLKSCNAACEFE